MCKNTNYQRGYNLADSYIKQNFKNIDNPYSKDEEFVKGYLKRLEEEKLKQSE